MSAPSLATEVAGVGNYPAIRFNQRERKILESVKTYVDSLSPDTIITTRGDIIIADASGDATRLAKGAANTILVHDGNDPGWSSTLAGLTLTSPTIAVAAHLNDQTTAAYDVLLQANGDGGTVLSADRILSFDLYDAARAIDLEGDLAIAGNFSTAGAYALTLTQTAATSIELPASSDGKLMGQASATFSYTDLNSAGAGVAVPLGDVIPSGAVVVRAWADVTAAFTGDVDSTATISVGIEDQDVDVNAADACSGAPWSSIAKVAFDALVIGTPDPTEFIDCSADRQIAMKIGAFNNDAALTAGACTIYVEYVY